MVMGLLFATQSSQPRADTRARIQGKFRAVFDSPEISEGAALFRAMAWCDEYESVYGTPRSEMSPVLVVPSS
jgi:hypothetical protein